MCLHHVTLLTLSSAAFSNWSFATASFCSRSVSCCACGNKEEKADIIYNLFIYFNELGQNWLPKDKASRDIYFFFLENMYFYVGTGLKSAESVNTSLLFNFNVSSKRYFILYLWLFHSILLKNASVQTGFIILFIYLTSVCNSTQDFALLNMGLLTVT